MTTYITIQTSLHTQSIGLSHTDPKLRRTVYNIPSEIDEYQYYCNCYNEMSIYAY